MASVESPKSLPASPDAERAVLGCIFRKGSDLTLVSQKLTPEDFYHPAHALLYEAMLALSATHRPIDYATLEDELTRRKTFEEIGGMDFLFSVADSDFLSANLTSYIEIVKNNALLRALIGLGQEVRERAASCEELPESILEGAESRLLEINQNRIYTGLRPLSETMQETIARTSALSVNQGKITGVTTGYRDLDDLLSGLQPSDLVLLAARPSMGKTSLGVNMAYHAARYTEGGQHPYRVAIFSLEMSNLQLAQRLLAMASGLNLQQILSGDLPEAEDWDRLMEGAQRLNELPLYIDDSSSLSIQSLRSKCRRMTMERGLDLVVVDYLQLMTTDDARRSDNRQQEITTISRGLKGLAKELNCPVLALSQLSRKTESREGSRPVMSDMRESGAIEQDADVVMLLYREDYYDPDTENQGITEVIVAKHRNGPTGKIQLHFRKEQTLFESVDYSPGPAQR